MFNIILMRPTTPLTNHDYRMAIDSQDLLPMLFQPWKKSHPDPVYISPRDPTTTQEWLGALTCSCPDSSDGRQETA